MTTDSVVQETAPVENVPVVVDDAPDGAEATNEVVADSTSAPVARETPQETEESKRIYALTADKYAAESAQRRAEWEARHWREQAEALKAKVVEPPSTPTVAPKLEDFAFDEEKYRAADREYNRAEAVKAAREVLREEREQQQKQSKAETFAERQTEYATKNPEYRTKVMERDRLPISEVAQSLIMESDLGPQVAEYLVDNPEHATLIFHMDQVRTAKEIGRIEAKFDKPPATPPPVIVPKVSSAPPPPPKIEAKDAAPPKSIDDPKISDAEFARIRRNQIAQRR